MDGHIANIRSLILNPAGYNELQLSYISIMHTVHDVKSIKQKYR